MTDIGLVADAADIIVDGYAFKKENDVFRVINLNAPDRAAVLSKDGTLLETSMDDIEVRIVQDYFECNKQFVEE